MTSDKVRITFSCDANLRDKLTERSDTEGIPRSQLIVELLEYAMGAEGDGGVGRDPAVNRLIYDIQERVGALERFKREINSWVTSEQVNTENLEQTVAHLLDEKVKEGGADPAKKVNKKSSIPSPKK